MWLYIPKNLAASPLPQEPEGSNLAFHSQYLNIELFASSSETHTPRPLSWPGWKTRPWMKRLSGLTLSPSTAGRGVERWISSLPDTLVSLSARRENASEKKTRATCGRTSAESSEKYRRRSCSLKTSSVTSPSASTTSGKTFSQWVTRLKRESLARQKSARRTGGNGCSFWPTPIVSSSGSWPRLCLQDGRLVMKQGKYQLGTHLAAVAWTTLYMLGMGRARASSLPMQVLLTPGNAGSLYGLSCNPLFLEALQGWPINWTDTDSQVTEFARWRQAMRSELCSMLHKNG